MRECWKLYAKKADFKGIGETFGIDPVVARIIRNRDIVEEKEIGQYLNGTLEDLYDPKQMKDMEKAAGLIETAVCQKKKILIASDYDDDGIFASMILLEGIGRIGGDVFADMPHRVKEGYGLNERMVEEAQRAGAGMIVTCDNGIAAFEPIAYAKQLGMSVVVTDHHEVPFEEKDGRRTYPVLQADAIVDPKQPDCGYPFTGLCGAGIAYKLVQVLYEGAKIEKSQLYELLEYAAIATVADVMDLREENRIIVKNGLRRLKTTKNLGLRAIMEVNQLSSAHLNAYHIGFVIGPCFNAAGRLETARMALDLLRANNEETAKKLAEELKQLNDTRKALTNQGVEKAIKLIESSPWKEDPIFLVRLKDCHESLAGIIAGRIREKYHRPVFVFTDAEGGIKASGRSIEGYHMFDGLVRCQDLLERFGGHAMAAGLSMQEKNLETLRQRLIQECGLTEKDFIPTVLIDVPMPLRYISEKLVGQIQLLEPFGKGNHKPLFAGQHFRVLKASVLGKNKNVCKMQVADEDGTVMDALYFGDLEEFLTFVVEEYGREQMNKMFSGKKNEIDLAFTYYPDINEFRGVRSLQIVVQNYCRIPKKRLY